MTGKEKCDYLKFFEETYYTFKDKVYILKIKPKKLSSFVCKIKNSQLLELFCHFAQSANNPLHKGLSSLSFNPFQTSDGENTNAG